MCVPSFSLVFRGDSAFADVEITNTGDMAGADIVQLYLRDDASVVTRPILELAAFERVELAAGETRTVRLEITPRAMSLWNLSMEREIEPGTFTISTGHDSTRLSSARLTVRPADPG